MIQNSNHVIVASNRIQGMLRPRILAKIDRRGIAKLIGGGNNCKAACETTRLIDCLKTVNDECKRMQRCLNDSDSEDDNNAHST
jgi:hypothetical protein